MIINCDDAEIWSTEKIKKQWQHKKLMWFSTWPHLHARKNKFHY